MIIKIEDFLENQQEIQNLGSFLDVFEGIELQKYTILLRQLNDDIDSLTYKELVKRSKKIRDMMTQDIKKRM